MPRLLRLSTIARGWGRALGLLYFAAVQRSSGRCTAISPGSAIGPTCTISTGICVIRAFTRPDPRGGLSVSDRQRPLFTPVDGPLIGPADVSPGCQSSLTATPYFVHSGWTTSAATAGVTVVAPAAARELASSEKNSSTPPGAYMYNTRAG